MKTRKTLLIALGLSLLPLTYAVAECSLYMDDSLDADNCQHSFENNPIYQTYENQLLHGIGSSTQPPEVCAAACYSAYELMDNFCLSLSDSTEKRICRERAFNAYSVCLRACGH
jgi:hypothetical protein